MARNRNVNFTRGRAAALPGRVGGCRKVAGNKGAFFAYQSARKPADFLRLNRFQCEVRTLALAGYATCLRLLSDLLSRQYWHLVGKMRLIFYP